MTDESNLAQVRVSSRTDLADLSDNPLPESPTSTDGWGELDNGIHGEDSGDKDGWDDIEPLEEAKPSAALASIQAAQKRPVSAPKPQGTICCHLLHPIMTKMKLPCKNAIFFFFFGW